ncbi:hypothetical protein P5673_033359 [Acropora cervicornis]|uniref:Uncharacterized protein n=1 Tax=Acropora cervicornis TaxID=6130 RepID=A0AAD9URA9_ACRCE|nr:hypothetical protein P5673_033359 [Acropora cervicornis]
MDPANASYLPSLFDHSHAKSVKTRITQTSRNAGSQVDDVPKVKRKSSRAREQSTVARPCPVITKPNTYWDKCLPSSNTLKEHDYVSVQADANAQKMAEDNPELIEIIRELQEKMQLLPKGTGEEEKLPMRVIFLTDFKENLAQIQN